MPKNWDSARVIARDIMSWLTEFVRPKIQALMGGREETPDHLWVKCPKCEHMIFHRELGEHHQVCHHCDHHFRLTAKERFEQLFDMGEYTLHPLKKVTQDPLKFRDVKKYTDRLKDYRQKTGLDDAIHVAFGPIQSTNMVVAAFNFSFMGGSMGQAVGQGVIEACELAVQTRSPLLVIPASGGARMQEGILSLMQMPRTTIAVAQLKEAGLPYLVLLTDPTTGGVSASFAMLGDITLAEPGAMVGFAGARVIEETMRQKLPEGFQTAEYLRDHGMVDIVAHRKDLPKTLGNIVKILLKRHDA